MKLKNVIIGDIVKVVPDDAYKKVCDFLKRDSSIFWKSKS